MHLVFHGGKCCGIKTIYGFGYLPDQMIPAKKRTPHDDPDKGGSNVSSSQSFYIPAAPVEKAIDRLDKYLAYADEHRPQGMIEVVLAQNPSYQDPKAACGGCGMCQVKIWGDILISRGFRLLNQNLNSNSGNVCYVYHRNSNVEVAKGTAQASLRGAEVACAEEAVAGDLDLL